MPLKNENQKIVDENNQLHLDVIRLKEELEQSGGSLRIRVKQLEGENTDMVYLTNQKDKKIQEMERSVQEMKQKLQQAL